MRHFGEIDDDRLAADGLAQRDGEAVLRVGEIGRGDEFAQVDGFAARIGQFDADGVAAGHDGDAGRDRRHRAGDVVGEADHARGLDPRRRLEFVKGDDRTGVDADNLALHGKIVQHALKQVCALFECFLRERSRTRFRRIEQTGFRKSKGTIGHARRQFMMRTPRARARRFAGGDRKGLRLGVLRPPSGIEAEAAFRFAPLNSIRAFPGSEAHQCFQPLARPGFLVSPQPAARFARTAKLFPLRQAPEARRDGQ